MRRLTWRNLVARKLRLVMSAFAIVLGIAFLSGSLVFTDTLDQTFSSIANDTVSDVTVRPEQPATPGLVMNVTTEGVPGSLVKKLAKVDGVARADGTVQGIGLFVITKDNKLLGGSGAPTLTFNGSDAPNAAGEQIASLSSGRAPEGDHEVALDARSAELAGYRLGDTVRMVTTEKNPNREATLVGIVEFGIGGLGGATIVAFDTETAQKIFFDGKNKFNIIGVTGQPGVSQKVLAKRVQAQLPQGFEAITGKDLAAESQDLIDQVMGFLSTFLLVFAGVAIVVGSFLIVNTFSILVAQRSRELALLRALGASRRQVTRSVLLEALIVGIIGSSLGILAGFALAASLKALFGLFGLDMSGSALVFNTSTAVVSYVVGISVTLLAAYLPARRAAKIPPVAAMRDDVAMPTGNLYVRAVLATVGGVLGAVGMTVGLVADVPKPVAWVGGGIFFVLMAVAAAAPLLAAPLLVFLRLIYRGVFGRIGLLAAENARRNPRRTAATASALMIGLALVTTMAVLGASINTTIDRGVDKQFTSDFMISNAIGQPFSTAIAKRAADVPGVARVSAQQRVSFEFVTGAALGTAADPEALESIFHVKWLQGRSPHGTDEITFRKDSANFHQAKVGGTVEVNFPAGKRTMKVVGIYDDTYVLGDAYTDVAALKGSGIKRADIAVAVDVAEGSGQATVGHSLENLVKDNPTVTVQDKQSFADAQRAQVNQLLFLIYALLGLAIVIAILGIVNTLGLSVIERTRELGLLRAVGVSRRQLRRMIRLEAIAISMLGALLGMGAGLLFGIALQHSFADDGIEYLAVPATQLAVFVAIAVVVGIIAAVVPAWRAARLDVLKAIATQ